MKGIAPGDIAPLRTLQAPVSLLKRIMDGVLILLRQPLIAPRHDIDTMAGVGAGAAATVHADDTNFLKPSWDKMAALLRTMSAPAFLKMLVDLPLSSINDETVELLRPYLEMPDFEEKSARFAARELAGLCSWVRGCPRGLRWAVVIGLCF